MEKGKWNEKKNWVPDSKNCRLNKRMTGMKWQNCEYKSELLRKYITTRNFQQRTWIKICHILSSENRVPFSFKELKCSPRGAPSTNSIIMYSLSSVKQTSAPKICPMFLRSNLSYEIATRHYCFPREMTCEEWLQKFYTDDVSLPRSL